MTTKITVLSLPGTGFPDSADPITADFHAQLDPTLFDIILVKYPATFGGAEDSYEVSRAAGAAAVYEALDALPSGTPVILSGYSQGAVVAGDVAADIFMRQLSQYNVVAVALIADGYRPSGVGLVPTGLTMAEGYGIAGQRDTAAYGVPTFWVSAWGDPIASLPAGNPLRTVADLVGWYSLKTPADAVNWGAKMLDAVVAGRLQDWWAPWKWAGWAGALAFARGYLFDGRHTLDYIRLGYTRTLAGRLAEFAVTGS